VAAKIDHAGRSGCDRRPRRRQYARPHGSFLAAGQNGVRPSLQRKAVTGTPARPRRVAGLVVSHKGGLK